MIDDYVNSLEQISQLITGIYLIAFNRKPKIVRLTFLHVAIPIRGDMNDVK